MSKLKTQPEWLRVAVTSERVGVDRENKRIMGYVVAQEGNFKSEGRGAFDEKSLQSIVALMRNQQNGLKSRLAHPTLSEDGIGKFLGRAKNARMSEATAANGQTVKAVRADLYLDPSSFSTPSGDLGTYVMDLAESDPTAMSSSLVLDVAKEEQLADDGSPAVDASGEELPPLWRPLSLHASDIVDTGDAVDGFLSATGINIDGLPDAAVRRGAELLDGAFAGQSREVVKARCEAWLGKYLSRRFGDEEAASEQPPETEAQPAPDEDEALLLDIEVRQRQAAGQE